jgi:glycosyltransferase involved in cell wall biosynthesis
LPQAIESVLAQDMLDWELIISDNISTDESPDIAQRYAQQDSRIKFFRNDMHISAVENFNLCYERADPDSTYVTLLASDDWWNPTFLSRTTEIGEQYPHVAIVHTDMYRADSKGEIINLYSDLYPHNTPPPGFHQSARAIMYGTFINIMAAIVRRRLKDEIYPSEHLLDPELPLTPDYDLWVQLLIRGAHAYYIKEPLAYYRRHDDSMTSPERAIHRLQSELHTLKNKLDGICPAELEDVRRDEMQKRHASIGFELLLKNQANEALSHLRQSHILSSWKRLDVTIARIIASLPFSLTCRAWLWRSVLSTARLVGKAS